MECRKERAEQQLASFIAKYTPEIASLAEAILADEETLSHSPRTFYDNYNRSQSLCSRRTIF